MIDHKIDFEEWVLRNNVVLVDNLNQVEGVSMGKLKKGDKVIYTNDFGVKFGPIEILGFCTTMGFTQRFIFLNKDSFWFPVRLEDIELIESI